MTELILASGSPRRRELLTQIWSKGFEVLPQDVDETALKKELPRDYIRRVTLMKGVSCLMSLDMTKREKPALLSLDTAVVCGRRILQKAANEDEARAQMRLLSGRRHRVMTCVALWLSSSENTEVAVSEKALTAKEFVNFQEFFEASEGRGWKVWSSFPGYCLRLRLVEAHVAVKRLTSREIDDFIASGEWKNVAVYRVHGLFGHYIKWLRGHPTCIEGLPLYDVRAMLVGGGLLRGS